MFGKALMFGMTSGSTTSWHERVSLLLLLTVVCMMPSSVPNQQVKQLACSKCCGGRDDRNGFADFQQLIRWLDS
jgi:hypothetical protein